jgi:hypothetical protein
MPTFATGVFKKLAYKAESTFNTLPGTSGGQYLRRVTSDLDLKKDIYQSNEIRTDMQLADVRHGIRKPDGTIKGELSPQTWQDFIAAALRKLFVATAAISAATFTIAGTGPTYTITRSAGSYITDGVKIGDVVRLTAGAFNAANLNLNLGVVNETATGTDRHAAQRRGHGRRRPDRDGHDVDPRQALLDADFRPHGHVVRRRTLVRRHQPERSLHRLQGRQHRLRPAGDRHRDDRRRAEGRGHHAGAGAVLHRAHRADRLGRSRRGERRAALRHGERRVTSPAHQINYAGNMEPKPSSARTPSRRSSRTAMIVTGQLTALFTDAHLSPMRS